MKPLSELRAALVLSLLTGVLAAQTPTYLDAGNPNPSAGNEGTVKTFHIGPFSLPAARIVQGKLIPGEYEANPAAPNPGAGWLTGYDNRIVDQNYLPVDQFTPAGGSDFYLHHAVFVKTNVQDLTCSFFPGERFAASGGERMPIALPNGYGYQINANDSVRCVLHIQNFTFQARSVYLEYSMTMQPLSANYVAVRPWWLDVQWCTSTYYVPVGSATHEQQRDYVVPRPMTILSLGPHLHCGGTKLDLINKTTGQPLWNFTNSPTACPIAMESVMPGPAITLPVGTTVTVKATYQQNPLATIDAMGIIQSYVVLQ